MRLSLQEDLRQLQSLGWRWERWLRRETDRLQRRHALREPPEARGEPHLDLDLRWVLEGDGLSERLTAYERYCLYSVHRAGSARQAALRFGLHRKDLEETLAEIEEYLYDRGFA